MSYQIISRDHLRGFKYAPLTGNVYRNNPGKNGKGRGRVGFDSTGYLEFKHNHMAIKCHTAAILITGGSISPGMHVDHKNGDRKDNRLSNLRVVTNRENSCNKEMHRKGKRPGVYRSGNGYMARIRINGVNVYLGQKWTSEGAYALYLDAVAKHARGETVSNGKRSNF